MSRLVVFLWVSLLLYAYLDVFLEANTRVKSKYGKYIGNFTRYAHEIKGAVYAVDENVLFIKSFWYDGTGPDAYFWVGYTSRPSPDGLLVPYPEFNDFSKGRDPPILKAYRNHDVILRLPHGKKISDFRWLSVWCRRFTVNFGEVFIPTNLEIPKIRVLPELKRLAHGLRSGNITILDTKTFYIPNLHYDGGGPDAYFMVGKGDEPHDQGIKVPNEMGTFDVLRSYQGEDIEIQLPGSLSVYDIDWLSIYCIRYKHNFGHVFIPNNIIVPPALGQTKITPFWWYNPTTSPTEVDQFESVTNCRELLDGRLQVRWEMIDDHVKIQLVAKMREDQYVAFGVSGETGNTNMIGGDVVLVYYDKQSNKIHAIDYFMTHKAECDGKSGVCSDEVLGGRNDVLVLQGQRVRNHTIVTYTRPLETNEFEHDRSIPRSGSIAVIAAFGLFNQNKQPNSHSITDKTIDVINMDFSSRDDSQCVSSLFDDNRDNDNAGGESDEDLDLNRIKGWPNIRLEKMTEFRARIGPTGGSKGYSYLTGEPSWGIAWYINDFLIPELVVERGETYTFIVEGGDDVTNPDRYHPFYITDSRHGGFGQNYNLGSTYETVYAGVEFDANGVPYPTAIGRYCEWLPVNDVDRADEMESFQQYFNTLQLECSSSGTAAVFNWTVPDSAPDTLYYQCFMHLNLGWKIKVVNKGDKSAATEVSQIFTIELIFTMCVFWFRYFTFS